MMFTILEDTTRLVREDVVTSEIPVGFLQSFLNEIREYPHLEYRELKLRRDAQVKETLVAPDGKYTIIWSKNTDDSLKTIADVYIGARLEANQWWEKQHDAIFEREKSRERARKQFNEQQQKQWESRSWWYKLWHSQPKPIAMWEWNLHSGTYYMPSYYPEQTLLETIHKWNVIV